MLMHYQVPALTGPNLSAPLTDSVDISYWLCCYYPNLLPPKHESTIRDLSSKLHDINIFTLSARRGSMPTEWPASGIPPTAIDALLAKPDSEISPEYRRALEDKRELYAFHGSLYHQMHMTNAGDLSHNKTKADALSPEQIERAERDARDFFAGVLALYKAQGSDSVWLFGTDVGPTLLDAHTVPFIARLMDDKVKRQDLVPPELQKYATRVMKRPEWDTVMHGRPTVYDASLGPVRDLDPLW